MINSVKEAKALALKWNAIKTDKERLEFLKGQKTNLMVVLDNDVTMVDFDIIAVEDEVQEEAIADIDLNSFNNYHGCNDAIVELFEFAGIRAEQC